MSSPHVSASFRNSCIFVPRHPRTNLPSSLLERKSLDFASKTDIWNINDDNNFHFGEEILDAYQTISSDDMNDSIHKKKKLKKKKKVKRKTTSGYKENISTSTNSSDDEKLEKRNFYSLESIEKDEILHKQTNNIQKFNNEDDQFLSQLELLKAENKKTLKSLEKLYNISKDYKKEDEYASIENFIQLSVNNLPEKKQIKSSKRHKKHKEKKKERLNSLGNKSPDKLNDTQKSVLGENNTLDKPVEKNVFMACIDKNSSLSNFPSSLNHSIDACNQTLMKAFDEVNGGLKDTERGDNELESVSSEDELDEKLKVTIPENHINILPESNNPSSFRGRVSSFDVIANMWENFSIDEYAPYSRKYRTIDAQEKAGKWSPNITIPEPFSMTVRDEVKAKVKSKKIERIEQEKLEKKIQEEAELHIRPRPTPVPPTTFLPLYKELMEHEEKKRQYIRDLSKQILKSSEKPFSFMEREAKKKAMKKSKSLNNVRKKNNEEKQRARFKANPFPEKLFDLTLADKLAEQEEYRKIKIKLRSQEMLASSSLPMSMKTRSSTLKHYPSGEKTRCVKEELKKRKQKSFQPQIHHDIPDFESLQQQFANELQLKKSVNTPTVCEPFKLHTSEIPARRWKFMENVKDKKIENSANGRAKRKRSGGRKISNLERSCSLSLNCAEETPVYSHTETSRLRHDLLRESLNKSKEEELRKSMQLSKKQRELNELRRSVAKKALAQDPSRNRERETKEKMRRFKESTIARKKEYDEYLRDVNDKLKSRPLLFEQESQTNARQKAQRRYEEILKEAGIEGDTLDTFLNESAYDQERRLEMPSRYNASEDDENSDGSDGNENDIGTNSDGSYVPHTHDRSYDKESEVSEDEREQKVQCYSSDDADDRISEDKDNSNDGSYAPVNEYESEEFED